MHYRKEADKKYTVGKGISENIFYMTNIGLNSCVKFSIKILPLITEAPNPYIQLNIFQR